MRQEQRPPRPRRRAVDGGSVFDWPGRWRSLTHAGRGLVNLVGREYNARVHLLATVLAIGLGLLVGLSPLEWGLLVLTIALVWMAEAMNTALELLADRLTDEHDPLVGRAKDIAAGGVLICAAAAVVIAAVLFLRRWL